MKIEELYTKEEYDKVVNEKQSLKDDINTYLVIGGFVLFSSTVIAYLVGTGEFFEILSEFAENYKQNGG